MAAPARTRPEVGEDVWIPTVCDMCYNSCTLRVHRVDGVAVKIEGIPEAPPNYGKICAKGNAALMNLYNPNRITRPLRRRNPDKGRGVDPQWEAISWDEAMAVLERELRRVMDEDPRKLIVASFDSHSGTAARAFTTAFGTPNFTAGPAGYFCGNGVHPVAYTFTGCMDMHPDITHAKLLLFFGSSSGFVANYNAMPVALEMAEARARGVKLVVVDPELSNAASQADEWVPIRPGTDAALALGMMHVLVHELGKYDRKYLQLYTNAPYLIGEDGLYLRDAVSNKPLVWDGAADRARTYDDESAGETVLEGSFTVQGRAGRPAFALLAERLGEYTPARVESITSIPAATVRRLACMFAEADQIGSTITIGGVELPYRPVSASWYRGATAHRHGMLNGLAMALLNVLVGAVDVPGGLVNANSAGPFGFPYAGQDGILTVGNQFSHMRGAYPPSPVKAPQTAEMVELFPVAAYARAMLWLGVLEPDRFKLPYRPDTLITCRTNLMTNTADPGIMERALKQMRFIATFADHHNETTAFADLVLPDTHFLERLSPLVMDPFAKFMAAPPTEGEWAWNLQQPVVEPRGESRHWIEVLCELAGRLEITTELNAVLNASAHLEGEQKMDPGRLYTWAEISDRLIQGRLGPGCNLESMKKQGYHVLRPRTPQEAFPRIFHKGRVPIYFEHYIAAGRQVKAVTAELGIDDWDVSDYQPLVEWKPCPSFDRSRQPEYDLYGVNRKLPFMTFTFSAENPWLMAMADRNQKVFSVALNTETARTKGLKAGDRVWLEAPNGHRAQAVLRLTQGIHPECVSIPGVFGRWAAANQQANGKGVHFNSLIQYDFDRLDTLSAALDACVRVKMTKA